MRFFRPIGDLKGWQRFGFEVAIIVFGLGITLIAQDLISNANRARETRQAMDAVEVDLVLMLVSTSERLAIEPCRREQTLALADQLQRPGDAWSFETSEGLNRNIDELVLPVVLRTPSRPWPDSSWRALLASSAATGLNRATFAMLSSIFDSSADIREAQNEAWRLRARLAHLAAPGTLNAVQRREARAVLSELAAVEGSITINAQQLREAILAIDFRNEQRLHAAFTRRGVAAIDAFVTGARPIYGACINDAEYQPIYDHYNALTGERTTIPRRETAP